MRLKTSSEGFRRQQTDIVVETNSDCMMAAETHFLPASKNKNCKSKNSTVQRKPHFLKKDMEQLPAFQGFFFFKRTEVSKHPCYFTRQQMLLARFLFFFLLVFFYGRTCLFKQKGNTKHICYL